MLLTLIEIGNSLPGAGGVVRQRFSLCEEEFKFLFWVGTDASACPMCRRVNGFNSVL